VAGGYIARHHLPWKMKGDGEGGGTGGARGPAGEVGDVAVFLSSHLEERS